MVYFITDGEYTKIGKAKCAYTRLKALQTANARVLSLLYSFPGGLPLEKKLHNYFKEYQSEANNEWFKIPHIKLRGMLVDYGMLDIAKASHDAKIINNSKAVPVSKLGKKKKELNKGHRSRVQSLLLEIRSQLKGNKMISYTPFVQKYKFSKKEISYFVRSARLSKDIYTHNSRVKVKKK
jgi:hypothetical protein